MKDIHIIKDIPTNFVGEGLEHIITNMDFEWEGEKVKSIIAPSADSTDIVVLWKLGFIYNGLMKDNSIIKTLCENAKIIVNTNYFVPPGYAWHPEHIAELLTLIKKDGKIIVPRTLVEHYQDFCPTCLKYDGNQLIIDDSEHIERSAWAESVGTIVG